MRVKIPRLLRQRAGFLYLAVVLDACSRQIVGSGNDDGAGCRSPR
jgi:hypothetical protein